jgi:tellurite resistance protein
MQDFQKTMVRSLVAVAWADGRVDGSEAEVVEALLDAFEANDAEKTEIKAYAATKRTLDDIPFAALEPADRDALLQHAVLLTFIDGVQTPDELRLVEELGSRLGLAPDRRQMLIEMATDRAKRFLG